MSYDSASAIRREINAPNLSIVSSTSAAKFHMFQKARLKAVHALVVTAGTNAAAGLDIYIGTASVGALTYGTSTAGVVKDTALIDAVIAASSYVELKGKATSEAVVSVAIEYQVDSDAVST